ncbi:Undecaprenyl phosphate-alpha-4-amino-4-deoxy-L-arabinose arabinosyl transferase [Variovorax sp. PBS-H4]|uniref:glycosyltransferase family 39 protein n=1 Tax=Variovorax sp. PBS-H4 TaxID=434008 RepID=UPI00131770EE|nr:glycosyltransferase family 39 protein [Variovorax sp. PBS-H4]VTU24915.1 Undecaprenyl phosphate-alpha-4-amino-4-deoxy-L-arabinose arabinosyl transferase [Variovorax sp. PBS-H4]
MKAARGTFGPEQAGLVLACLFAWFAATAWLRPLMSPDEGRYAGVAFEMLRSGDWIVPRLDGMPFFHKPPLFYWISAAAMGLMGASEWPARLPSLIGATLAAGGLFLFLRRWAGPARATLAAAVLATMPFFYIGAQYANLDMLVAGCIAATLLLAVHAALSKVQGGPWRATLAGAFAFAALGVLAKGLIGVVLPGGIFLAWCAAIRRPRLAGLLAWPPGWALLLAIMVPWFAAVEMRHPGFLDYFVLTQHVRRFASGGFNGEHPFWFYLPVIAVLTLPWIAWAAAALRPSRGPRAPLSEVDWLMWIWCGVIVLFFSLPRSKLVGYVLPALPPLAYLIATAALGATRAGGRWAAAPRWTVIASGAVCIAAAVGLALQAAPPGKRLQLPAGEAVGAADQVLMLGAYYYELPLYWGLRQPVQVSADWTPTAVAQRDDWRKELYEAGRFDPERSAALLIDVRRLPAALCVPHATWLIGSSGAPVVLPWLAQARLVAVDGDTAVWRFAGGATSDPRCLQLKDGVLP